MAGLFFRPEVAIFLHRDAGTVSVLGLDPQRSRKTLAYRIGAVFGQKSQLWFHLPPLDSFRLLADIYDVPQTEARRRITELPTAFLTSHDTTDIERLCRRAVGINHGRILWNEAVAEMTAAFVNHKIIKLKLADALSINAPWVTVVRSGPYRAVLHALWRVVLQQLGDLAFTLTKDHRAFPWNCHGGGGT